MHPQPHAETRAAPQAIPDDDALLTSRQARAMVGNVSAMCISRWLRDERVRFPQPVRINTRNYWRTGDLRQWLRTRTTSKAAA